MLLSFTHLYTIAQAIATISIIALSLYLNIHNTQTISYSFILTRSGELYLDKEPLAYQLVATSRLGFIGCWLIMLPIENSPNQEQSIAKATTKQLFIFRDSLASQDFSRIANIIKQLA